jgi:hypothetical protein
MAVWAVFIRSRIAPARSSIGSDAKSRFSQADLTPSSVLRLRSSSSHALTAFSFDASTWLLKSMLCDEWKTGSVRGRDDAGEPLQVSDESTHDESRGRTLDESTEDGVVHLDGPRRDETRQMGQSGTAGVSRKLGRRRGQTGLPGRIVEGRPLIDVTLMTSAASSRRSLSSAPLKGKESRSGE